MSSYMVFADAVTSGHLVPSAVDNLWIEAGSMSSGGSGNQLELPRGANLFFGYNFNYYGQDHVTIGYPLLTSLGNTWNDRPLTWHGHNAMERINLPTKKKGGFDYKGTAILFHRYQDAFELRVFPWNHPSAVAWRANSSAAGMVFRLGYLSGRICGVF